MPRQAGSCLSSQTLACIEKHITSNHMKNLLIAIAMTCLAFSSKAQPAGTVNELFSGLLSMTSSQCQGKSEAQAKLYESKGQLAEAHSIRGAEKMLCECLPAKIKQTQGKLSKAEKGRRVSEAEFSNKYLPVAMNPCVGEQLRSTYGSGCAARFARFTSKSASFCSCMSGKLAEVSDAEIVDISKASADYLPAVSEAKKRGQPVPEKPEALQAFGAIEAACMKE